VIPPWKDFYRSVLSVPLTTDHGPLTSDPPICPETNDLGLGHTVFPTPRGSFAAVPGTSLMNPVWKITWPKAGYALGAF
jgi:hypothetical protein